MAEDTSSLALSDIMLPMSPSPPQEPARHITPEPLQEAQITSMRRRLVDMGLSGGDRLNTSSRERELADMVLRLTDGSTRSDPLQLVRQAETIANLSGQREFLIRQAEERNARWESEREGWSRMAEALIAQRNRTGTSAAKDEELEKKCLFLESDNKVLREKLSDTHLRLSALEAELIKLRPLLLMQPFSLAPAHPLPPSQIFRAYNHSRKIRKEKEREPVAQPPPPATEEEEVEDDADAATNFADKGKGRAQPLSAAAGPSGDHYRKADTSAKRSRKPAVDKRKVPPPLPILSDARSEHLLLAAQRIGRQRAGIVSGLVNAEVKERERERIRAIRRQQEEEVAVPRTPNGGAGQAPSPPSRFVFHNSSTLHANPTVQSPVLVQAAPGYHHTRTPSRAAADPSSSRNPHTPLDSLLSAAQSLMDEDGGAADAPANGRLRRGSTHEMPESPIPKRRKITAGTPGPSALGEQSRGESSTSSRVPSALDVLADQAAAFSSKEQGKGKRRADADRSKGAGPAPATRKPRSKAPPKEKSGAKRSTAVSNISTPRMISPANGSVVERDRQSFSVGPSTSVEGPQADLVSGSTNGSSAGRLRKKKRSINLRPVMAWNGDRPTATDDDDDVEMSSSPARVPTDAVQQSADSQELQTSSSTPPLQSTETAMRPAEAPPLLSDQTSVQFFPDPPPESLSIPPPVPPPLPYMLEADEQPQELLTANEERPDILTTLVVGPRQYDTTTHTPSPPSNLPPFRTSSIANALATPITLTRSRSEDRQDYMGGDDDGLQGHSRSHRRAASIPPRSATENDVSAPDDNPHAPDMIDPSLTMFDSSPGMYDELGVGGQEMQMVLPGKRPRGPYVKWTKEEDEQLAQAVAKYGQKWDLVQKALPSRGYHQVRQRWLRKLGVFDSKPDLSSFQTSFSSSSGSGSRTDSTEGAAGEPLPKPKLGLAPLSSELALSSTGRAPNAGASPTAASSAS